MAEHECSICLRPVDPHAAWGSAESGGYIPVQFPNEAPVEVWLHHRCLLHDGEGVAPIDGRTMLGHADHHPEHAAEA